MSALRYWLEKGLRVRHVESGEIYEVLGFADFQCSTTRQHDHETLVLYQPESVQGKIPPCARLIGEFCDGRYEIAPKEE